MLGQLSTARGDRAVNLATVVLRFTALVATLVTVVRAGPLGVAGWSALGASVIGCLAWTAAGQHAALMRAGLLVTLVANGVLLGLAPDSAASALGGLAAFSAATRLPIDESAAVVATGMGALLVTFVASGPQHPAVLLYLLVLAASWWAGLGRRQYVQQAEQARLLLAETQRATEASNEAAVLAERARIAREIHDIQAHALSALSLQLQAAAGLLQHPSLPAANPVLTKITGCVQQAGRLARDGLAETSRAVHALRGDPTPLPELLAALADSHNAEGDHRVSVLINGAERTLPAEAGITVYRAVQEALTNARKHAPAAPVDVQVDFLDREVAATVTNPLPADGAARPLTDTGAGYGLAGLRERAELAGGTVVAGPVGGGWQVCVRIPA